MSYDDYGLLQLFTTTKSTTTARQYRRGNSDDIELDDTAPLPLLIGIGLALVIGAIILILICCLCRRRRPSSSSSTGTGNERPPNAAYQRAPVTDGGMAYPMTAVPPMTYPVAYPPPHMGGTTQHDYGVIGPNMNHVSGPQYPNQPHPPPHFGGVPTFPPNQYLPPTTPIPHNHSLSHSSQTSSVSGTTADPLVPSSSPAVMPQHPYMYHHQQQQMLLQQQQHFHYQQQQQQQQQNIPVSTVPNHTPISHQNHQQAMPGSEPSAMQQQPPFSYSSLVSSNQQQGYMSTPPPNITVTSPNMTVTPVTSPPLMSRSGPQPSTPSSTDGEEEEEEEEE